MPAVSRIALFFNIALTVVTVCAITNSLLLSFVATGVSHSISSRPSTEFPVSTSSTATEAVFAPKSADSPLGMVAFAHPHSFMCLILNNDEKIGLMHTECSGSTYSDAAPAIKLLSVEAKAERSKFSSAFRLGNTFATDVFDWEWIPVSVKAPETGVAEVHVLSA